MSAGRRIEQQADDAHTSDKVWILGGTFRLGLDHHYPEAAPSHGVSVDGSWIDRTPVTNQQFKAFVKATGHVATPFRRTATVCMT